MNRTARRRPTASELVRHVWLGRIEAEYRSAAITQHLCLWLIQVGASPDLIRLGLRIVDDELKHAELSRKVWLAAGGHGAPTLDQTALGLRREYDALEHDVLMAIVRVFCLGETVAVPLFANLRKHTTVNVAERAYDRILKDEVRHRDFGWLALGWLLERPDASVLRAMVESRLPSFLAALERSYGEDLEHGIREVSSDERAWGVAPWPEYTAILRRTYVRDYERRFSKLGIRFSAPARSGPR